ncbi:hypothetical protein OG21DRAFT_1141071 [Imleria badia]|nr:hypothetical protein OG21DRAFT_1141071 [Imleria badia]
MLSDALNLAVRLRFTNLRLSSLFLLHIFSYCPRNKTMASDPQSTLASLQQNDYVNLLVVTAVGYDYILTFSREVEYIWNKPWTVVSTFFVLVRYFGLCAFITLPLVGTSFLPGPPIVSFLFTSFIADPTIPTYSFVSATYSQVQAVSAQFQRYLQGMAIGTLGTWAVFIFICAADFVMILRVWAMYHRSRLILGVLLTSYVAEIIPSTIGCIVYSNPRNVPSRWNLVSITVFAALSRLPVFLVGHYSNRPSNSGLLVLPARIHPSRLE